MIDKISITSWLSSLGIHGVIACLLYPVLRPSQPGDIYSFNVVWESQPTVFSPIQMPEKKAPSPHKAKKVLADVSVEKNIMPPAGRGGQKSCMPSSQMGLRKSHKPLPTYPWICRKRHQEGTVTMKVKVDEDGNVIQAQVYKTSGYEKLDEAALKAVKSWTMAESHTSKILSIAFRLNG